MNEDTLRALVRETLARLESRKDSTDDSGVSSRPVDFARHSSHHRYTSLPESGGPCFIEPGVPCNHCGYCQSHGH